MPFVFLQVAPDPLYFHHMMLLRMSSSNVAIQSSRSKSWSISTNQNIFLHSNWIYKQRHMEMMFKKFVSGTFLSWVSDIFQSLDLRRWSSSNFMLMSSMESCSRSQNPARSCAVARGWAFTSWPKTHTSVINCTASLSRCGLKNLPNA